jgi:hypothetical protein
MEESAPLSLRPWPSTKKEPSILETAWRIHEDRGELRHITIAGLEAELKAEQEEDSDGGEQDVSDESAEEAQENEQKKKYEELFAAKQSMTQQIV